MQRFFDVLFSGLALLVLSPLLVPIALLLRFTGEGEIFFLQERVGKEGKLFKLYKFATMLKNSPNIGTGTVTLKDDPRVLPMGKFLRKTKFNELPQLLNVLLGHMSLIGPRPQTKSCFEAFDLKSQNNICSIRPGLSGIGPVVFRDEESLMNGKDDPIKYYGNVIAPYKGLIESWYINRNTIKNYFVLIFVTIWVVFRPKSQLVWKVFKDLPEPPDSLRLALNYPNY